MIGKKIRRRITVARKMLGRERPIFVKGPMPKREARKIARLRRTAVSYPFKVIPVRTSLTPDKMIEIMRRTRITSNVLAGGKLTYYHVGHRFLVNTVLNELNLKKNEGKLLHEFMGYSFAPSELPKTDRHYMPGSYYVFVGYKMIKELDLNRTKELLNQTKELVIGIRHAFATEYNKRLGLAKHGKKVVLPPRRGNDMFANPATSILQHCGNFLDALRKPEWADMWASRDYLSELEPEKRNEVIKFFEGLHKITLD